MPNLEFPETNPQKNDDWVYQDPFKWWDEAEESEKQTRDKSHPDGFSFLQPLAGEFWQTWMQFSSQEISRMQFIRREYLAGRLQS